MREILFRGKRKNGGEWVYGYLLRSREICTGIGISTTIVDEQGKGFAIIPETVGQFTGLTDKNGKKIFEGDFVYMHGCGCGFSLIEEVIYQEGGFSPFSVAGWECTPDADEIKNEIEVIGNIHDNKLEDFGSHTFAEWEALKEKYKNRCAFCGELNPLTKDYIVPLSKGGTNYINNIQPLCRDCNSRKSNKTIRDNPELLATTKPEDDAE